MTLDIFGDSCIRDSDLKLKKNFFTDWQSTSAVEMDTHNLDFRKTIQMSYFFYPYVIHLSF